MSGWSVYAPISRREAYEADITYGTNNEFGFDYLRDNMVLDTHRMVQRDLHYAIVDEVDNILIDEARTPLIISGQAEQATDRYYQFAQIVRQLREGKDYEVDHKHKSWPSLRPASTASNNCSSCSRAKTSTTSGTSS